MGCAEILVEVPVEHGLLMENLLDLAHAPFTHTTTFARGWPIPDAVRFQMNQALAGHWHPYPIENLPERERLVLSLYYERELNLKEIGEVLGVSESRVCQIHSQAAMRLRAMITE